MKNLFFLLTMLCMIALNASAKSSKTSYRNGLVLTYSQANSVYEDENIKLEIYNEELWATNKTKKTIFIDTEQCFFYLNGVSVPFRNTGDKDKASKKKENKASKRGISDNNDLFITVAPSIGLNQNETSIWPISINFFGKYSTTESPSGDFTEHDKIFFNTIAELASESHLENDRKEEYTGTTVRHFTEDESFVVLGFSIAYAFSKNAEEWMNVSLTTWVSDVIFAPFYVEMPKDLKKKEKRGFNAKETAPAIIHIRADRPFEFDDDKSPIILFDWVGNFKKGEFGLYGTWISKIKSASPFWALLGGFGAIAVAASFREVAYKRIIKFDGIDSDWGMGILEYASSVDKTESTEITDRYKQILDKK